MDQPNNTDQQWNELQPRIRQEIADYLRDYALRNQYGLSNIPVHEHSGTDTLQVNFDNLASKKMFVLTKVAGTDAAFTAYYGVFFIAPYACNVLSVYLTHGTAGTNAGSVGLNIEKLTPGVALDNGVNLLPTAYNLKGAANYVTQATMTPILAYKQLAAGDRLALRDLGTLTSVADVCVIIEIQY
jgi:hypothetical protein